jgi:hypothetical protein
VFLLFAFHCSAGIRKTLKINYKVQILERFTYTATMITTPRTELQGKSDTDICRYMIGHFSTKNRLKKCLKPVIEVKTGKVKEVSKV